MMDDLEKQWGNSSILSAAASFVQHLRDISVFKLELQSGNARFGSKSKIFLAVQPWNLMDDLENQ